MVKKECIICCCVHCRVYVVYNSVAIWKYLCTLSLFSISTKPEENINRYFYCWCKEVRPIFFNDFVYSSYVVTETVSAPWKFPPRNFFTHGNVNCFVKAYLVPLTSKCSGRRNSFVVDRVTRIEAIYLFKVGPTSRSRKLLQNTKKCLWYFSCIRHSILLRPQISL